MSDDNAKEERKQIYASTRQDLLVRNLSNSEKYDNAILTLSTGALGISLAFIKDVVPLDKSVYLFLLIISWWFFGASIVFTLTSFVFSQLAVKRQLEYAEKYYLDENEEYLNKSNLPALLTEYINYVSGFLFTAGIIATICFVSFNIEGDRPMAKKTAKVLLDGAPIPKLQKIQPGATERGATIPPLQPINPSTPSSQQSSNSQSSPAGGTPEKTKK